MTLLEGINDITFSALPVFSTEVVTAEDLIGGYRQIIERAHMHGIKVAGATIMPVGGVSTYRESGEAVRQAVNQWIRSSGAFDAVIDFDALMRDPADPKRLRPEFDPGDHVHPDDKGNERMAQAIDLAIFSQVAKETPNENLCSFIDDSRSEPAAGRSWRKAFRPLPSEPEPPRST